VNKWLRMGLLGAGVGAFAYFIIDADPAKIKAAFVGEPLLTDRNGNGTWDEGEKFEDVIENEEYNRGLGWFGLLVLIPYAVVFTIDTIGWTFTFGPTALKGIPFRVVWSIRLVGEAINNVVPSMYVGGETAKVYLLKRQGVTVMAATSAAVRSKTAQSVAQSTFVALGAAVAAYSLPDAAAATKWTFAGIALLGFIIAALLFKIQKRGIFTTLIGWVRKLGFKLKSLVAKEGKIRELDNEIYNFYNRDQKDFRRCTAIYLVGWVVDTVEIMVVAHLLGVDMAWSDAFAMEAFISVARGFNIFVPGSLGVQEFGIVGLFTLFGYGPDLGLIYAIVRRGRDVFFAGLGWSLLYLGEASWKGMREEIKEAEGK
jgi:uncharacterized protein (TIRG00374 family)